MIPGLDITEFLRTTAPLLGILVVAGIVFAESGLLVGFFLPGDSLLFTVGFLASQGVFGNIHISLVVLAFFAAAALGDSVGYAFGHKVGRKLFRRKESLVFDPANLQRAESFYETHGAVTIILARFMPIIRTFAPIVAGIGKMRYRTFLFFNLLGALLWAVGITYAGYFVGGWFEARGISIDNYLLPIIALIVILSILPPAIHIFKEPSNRKQLASLVRRRLHRLKK